MSKNTINKRKHLSRPSLAGVEPDLERLRLVKQQSWSRYEADLRANPLAADPAVLHAILRRVLKQPHKDTLVVPSGSF